jgi:ComF family protein
MSAFEAVIGLLSPPDCLICGLEGAVLCPNCSSSGIKPFGERCLRCDSLSPSSRTCVRCRAAGPLSYVWISTNYEAAAQQLVRKYKFGHLRAAAGPLSGLMIETFLIASPPAADYLIIPVPTATSRMRQRGFGHSELLARMISQKLRMEQCSGLRRLGQSRQLGSGRQDRLTQLVDSFAVKNPNRIAGRDILLIDDVLTTGGTLISAAKALKLAGAKQVNALVFAKRL